MWIHRHTATLTPTAMAAAAVTVALLAMIVLPTVAPADNALADDALADNDLAEDSEPYSEWSGLVGVELRAFTSSGQFPGQDDDATGSVVLEPEYFRESANGSHRVVVRPFLRLDSADDERSHFDLREAYWQVIGDEWSLDVGLRKVFWGVAESAHLVDVINQTDGVEDVDGEDKLGQPMIRAVTSRPWGQLQLYLLPGFRERTSAGRDGRLRPALHVDADAAKYESSAEDGHVDLALRYSRVLGDIDLGVSYFRGTSREPLLLPRFEPDEIVLAPYYAQIDQLGVDAQATLDAWLLKLEAVSRWSAKPDGSSPGFGDYLAAVAGFEYTFFDLKGTGFDVGVLTEYLWDERRELATTPFEDDVFVASRIAWNDVQSTELLVGGTVDLGSGATFVNVEGSRRLGERYELEVRLRAFSGAESGDPLASLVEDDYLQVSVKRFF